MAGDSARGNRRYQFVIDRSRGQTAVIQAFQPGKDEPTRFEFDLPADSIALANVPADRRLFPEVTWLRSFLTTEISAYRPAPGTLREAAHSGMGEQLRPDAANLPWLLHDLLARDPEAFADWISHVRLGLPAVETLIPYVRESDRRASFRVQYKSGLDVDASGLSEGTLRILALTAPAFLLDSPDLLIVEQPEDGLHPLAIESVLKSFQLRLAGQVWTSTHSPVVLAHVPLDNIIVIRPGSTGTIAISGSKHPSLAAWQGALNPGELYAAGILS